MRRLAVALLFLAGCCAEPPADPQPIDAPGLHNVYRVSDKLYSGSSPDDDRGFAALKQLGIKTIISVDGATPNVAAAEKHALRYVHLPFGYDGIPRDRAAELAAAVAELPGPIYLHCHHGKHRGPAAVAVVQIGNAHWDAARATAWMKTAGTDPRYTGLYAVVARPPTVAEKAAVAGDWKPVANVPDLTRRMVEIDARWDHLKLVKAAGWKAPPDHPDIDPPHEALQLVEHYRESARLDSVKRRGPAFVQQMTDAEASAGELEQALRAKSTERAAVAFGKSASACAKCHDQFRDKPGG